MNDTKTTLADLKKRTSGFVDKREWGQKFHNAKNLSMAIATEASELLEKFKWIETNESQAAVDADRDEVEHELVDIIMASLCFANKYDIDIATAFERKMQINEKKYPVEKCKGRADKYTAYE
jgi:NTP pyrophosphatase (non-canonical NTP hydrolase)